MAGAPVPIPVPDLDTKILSVADLQEAASKKLPNNVRGNQQVSLYEACLRALSQSI